MLETWLISDDFAINIIAGLAVMVVEIVVIFIFIRRVIDGHAKKQDRAKWAPVRLGLRGSTAQQLRFFSLMIINLFDDLPIREAEAAREILTEKPIDDWAIDPQRLSWYIEDIERLASLMAQDLAQFITALPPEDIEIVVRISRAAHIVQQMAYDIRTSRAYGRLIMLDRLTLDYLTSESFQKAFHGLDRPSDLLSVGDTLLQRLVALMEHSVKVITRSLGLLEARGAKWQHLLQDRPKLRVFLENDVAAAREALIVIQHVEAYLREAEGKRSGASPLPLSGTMMTRVFSADRDLRPLLGREADLPHRPAF
ncbi:hypothetical protein PB2503_06942 [Parvularcula bermudensis HTCC2503]|uniref:Uncharacterized protein n=1 Tax=Parvularcula bermudensis (strain ATCC BAA-594 / HTCC2503 / KCTC 12087) TaxID=314260 RepID=E0TE79_PARBH|nr:hypothetical protein [Parvularcula bermudensis]ADM09454.1 hypothetical protein PB2503_06942 [Parvularcula bermudensis HTCC2503]